MGRTIGFGIIGCGTIAPWHADSVAKIDGAQLVAVSDVVEEAAQKMGQKYQADWYTDYQQMLAREDVDVLCILTPSGMRKEIVLKAAEAGKHVVVEKPIEVTLERIDQMIEACEKAGVKLAVIFQNRFLPAARKVKEAMEKGKLGKPILGDAYIKWHRTQQYYDSGGWRGTWRYDGGGALMNQSVHTIDLLLWIMGPVESISAKIATLAHKIEVEDLAVATLRFANGALGVIEGSTAISPGFSSRLEIHGENGSVILKGEQVVAWQFKDGEQIPLPFPPEKEASGGQADPTNFSTEGHYLQLKDMVDAVKTGREPLVNGREGRKAVELIQAIYQSAKTGKEVSLPL